MEQKIRRDRNIGSNLRRLRDQYGISQEKLCARITAKRLRHRANCLCQI